MTGIYFFSLFNLGCCKKSSSEKSKLIWFLFVYSEISTIFVGTNNQKDEDRYSDCQRMPIETDWRYCGTVGNCPRGNRAVWTLYGEGAHLVD